MCDFIGAIALSGLQPKNHAKFSLAYFLTKVLVGQEVKRALAIIIFYI